MDGMNGKHDNGRNITSYLATFVNVGGCSEQRLLVSCVNSSMALKVCSVGS